MSILTQAFKAASEPSDYEITQLNTLEGITPFELTFEQQMLEESVKSDLASIDLLIANLAMLEKVDEEAPTFVSDFQLYCKMVDIDVNPDSSYIEDDALPESQRIGDKELTKEKKASLTSRIRAAISKFVEKIKRTLIKLYVMYNDNTKSIANAAKKILAKIEKAEDKSVKSTTVFYMGFMPISTLNSVMSKGYDGVKELVTMCSGTSVTDFFIANYKKVVIDKSIAPFVSFFDAAKSTTGSSRTLVIRNYITDIAGIKMKLSINEETGLASAIGFSTETLVANTIKLKANKGETIESLAAHFTDVIVNLSKEDNTKALMRGYKVLDELTSTLTEPDDLARASTYLKSFSNFQMFFPKVSANIIKVLYSNLLIVSKGIK